MANNKYVNAVYSNPDKNRLAGNTGSTTSASTPIVTNKYVSAVYNPQPYTGVKVTLKEPAKAAVVKPTTGPMSARERYKQEIPYSTSDILRQNAIQNATNNVLFGNGMQLTGDTLMAAATSTDVLDQKEARRTADELTAKIAELRHQQNIYFDAEREKELEAAKREYAALEDKVPKTTLFGDTVGKGAGVFDQGVANFADFMSNAIPRVEGWVMGVDPEETFTGQLLKPATKATGAVKDYVDTTVAKIDENAAEKIGDSKVKQAVYDLGSGVVAALPQAVLAVASGGASTVTQLPAQTSGISATVMNAATKAMNNPMTKLSFAQNLGNSYEDAKAQGATDMEAIVSATISSYVNALVETSGGIDALPNEIRDLDLTTPKKVWNWVKSALDEGKEEVVQNVITKLTNKGVFAEDTPLFSTTDENAVVNPKRMAGEFAMGTAIGGILGGGQMLTQSVIDSIMPRLPQQQFANPQSAQDAAVSDIVNIIAAENNGAQGQNKNAPANEARAEMPRISMQDFTNRQSEVFNNVAYEDTQTQKTIMQNMHNAMVGEGRVVQIPESTQAQTEAYYPDLRDMKKKDRVPILKQKISELKTDLRKFLNGLRGVNYEFEVNGNILDAKLYDTGIKEVMEKVTQEKASMLLHSDKIFQNAQYLYSTPDYDGDPNVYRWNYFYTPVQIGAETVGVRIAVRDMAKTNESQIYNWGIKKDATLGGGRPGEDPNATGASSVASSGTTLGGGGGGNSASHTGASSVASNPDIPQSGQSVNGEIGDMGANPAMGAADSGFDLYSHASIEHGAIPPGENPARVVDVPKSMDGESNVMQTVRTIMEADATPDAAIPELEQAIVDGRFSKMPITDQAASGRAESTIRQVGYQQALADWRAEVRKGEVSKDSVAMGETLYNAAVNSNDYKSAVKIAIELSTQVRSAAQALQAVRMLKKMSPAAQLYGVKQSVDNLQKTLIDKYGDRAPNLTVNEELAAKFLEAETDADRKAAEEALYKDIAKQIPATFADKWNAWRYLSMLGNARTHVRNIAGNALFAPVRFAKNKLGAAMEAGAQAVGLIDQSQRTKAFAAASKDLMSAARADYKNVERQIMSAGKYNSASNIIDENRKIFDNVVLETLRQGNSKALEWEDSFFSKEAYASSLASYLKAQGFTAADFTGDGMTSQQKDAARAYAIKEAQKATYRDINGFSEAISSIGFKNPGNSKTKKAVNAAIEGVMPFKKTPANILVRGMEYSPAGLLKALTVDIAQVKNGKITAGEYMDHLASGLTGSGLFALGCLLSNMGLLVGGTPEDEEQADLEGRQAYALEVGGKSVTLDWLAPEAMPVFMGVELMEAIREGGGDASLTDKVLSFVRGLSGPMLEMSMMSSLQDALEATEYADDKLLAFMANGALGYLKQAQPTLFGQLERALESRVRKTTFTQEGDKYLNKDAQYMVGSVANKIPFLDYNQVSYIDAWGRTEDMGGIGERLLNNMLNPAYVSDIKETPVDKEIKRLEEVVGGNLTPSRADKVLTINSEKVILTADEYVTYAQAKGQNDMAFRQNLIDSDMYAGLDDATKAKAMENSKDLANVLAIKEAGFEPVMSDWQSELVNADAETITRTLIAKAVESQAGTTMEAKYTSYGDMLDAGTIDDQIALSLLPESTLSDYMEFAKPKNVPASALMDALAYMNSEDAKTKYNEKTGKEIKGEGRQDHMKEYIASLDLTRAQKGGLWCVFYKKSTCPEYWR